MSSYVAAAPASVRAFRGDAVWVLSLYLVLLTMIPSELVVGPFGAAGRPAVLLAAAMLAWYLLAKQHPAAGLDRGRQPVRIAAAALTCSVLASYVSASMGAMSAEQISAANRGIIMLAGWLGIMLVAADGITDQDRLATLVRRIVFCATVMAALGIAEFATGADLTKYVSLPGLTVHQQVTDLMTRLGLIRANSTAAQPLEFAAALTISLPLAIHQARYAVTSRRRVLDWLQVALIALTIPMTVSRSAVFALGLIAVLLIPTWPAAQRWRACAILLAFPVAVWLIAPTVLSHFFAAFHQLGSDTSTTSRADAMALAAPLIGAHPWFGEGLATFTPQAYFYVDDQFITSLIETGVIGLLTLLAIFGCGWYLTRSARLAARDQQAKDLARSLAASLLVAATCFATFDVLSFSIASGLFFLLVGCAGAAWRLAVAGSQAGQRVPAPRQPSAS